jgi:hypothetical protein
VDKQGRARNATNDHLIRRKRIACWKTKATGYAVLVCFSMVKMASRPRVNITLICTLPVLSNFNITYEIVIRG